MGRNLVRIVGLTLALGATVVASWLGVRGLSVLNGPGPFLDPSWYAVWAIQAGLAFVIGSMVGRSRGRQTSGGAVIGAVILAWIGELIVLTLLTPILAGDGDLRPIHAPYVWLVATGGIIQPVATIIGAFVGRATPHRVTSSPAG